MALSTNTKFAGGPTRLTEKNRERAHCADTAVALAVQLGTLADGTSYTAQTTLDAAAKKIRVVIQNTGHHPLAR